jgi:hypothetical protein
MNTILRAKQIIIETQILYIFLKKVPMQKKRERERDLFESMVKVICKNIFCLKIY